MVRRLRLDNEQHWRDRAEEVRTVAHLMEHSETRRTMLSIAAEYDLLAQRARDRDQDHGELDADTSRQRNWNS